MPKPPGPTYLATIHENQEMQFYLAIKSIVNYMTDILKKKKRKFKFIVPIPE